eukprot:scaffold77026_cov54-Phaeocystis_antarctica.AAC.2
MVRVNTQDSGPSGSKMATPLVSTPLTDCQLIVHSLASRHCCDVHSQLGTILASAGGRRALHSDRVGEMTLTRPRIGFHSGMRSSCEYASKHASAG